VDISKVSPKKDGRSFLRWRVKPEKARTCRVMGQTEKDIAQEANTIGPRRGKNATKTPRVFANL